MEPALKPAAEFSKSKVVGVLATPATFQGELYHSLINRFGEGLEILQNSKDVDQFAGEGEGASRLAYEFLFADDITVLLGQAINPAHLNPNLPQEMGFKSRSVQAIVSLLKDMGKNVTLEIHWGVFLYSDRQKGLLILEEITSQALANIPVQKKYYRLALLGHAQR